MKMCYVQVSAPMMNVIIIYYKPVLIQIKAKKTINIKMKASEENCLDFSRFSTSFSKHNFILYILCTQYFILYNYYAINFRHFKIS